MFAAVKEPAYTGDTFLNKYVDLAMSKYGQRYNSGRFMQPSNDKAGFVVEFRQAVKGYVFQMLYIHYATNWPSGLTDTVVNTAIGK